MQMKGYGHYKDQAVNTMTQGELLLLLYDELMKRLTRAELALKKQEYEIFEASVERSAEIINYLDATLDRQYEISSNLSRLYEFFDYELTRVKIGRNERELQRVKTMVGELRESFRIAQQNNTSGK